MSQNKFKVGDVLKMDPTTEPLYDLLEKKIIVEKVAANPDEYWTYTIRNIDGRIELHTTWWLEKYYHKID